MKKILKEKLETVIFLDRKKSLPASDEEKTARLFFQKIVDAPLKDVPVTRDSLKRANNFYEALAKGDDLVVEDADFDWFKRKIEQLSINNNMVYGTVCDVLDSAEDFKF